MNSINYYNKNQFLPGNVRDISELELAQTTLNYLNYRTKNFSNIDWSDAVVVFGCSQVFGSRLADSDTICYQLEQIIQRPVINMGVPASSITFSVFNQIALAEQCAKPFAVVNLWTNINRLPYFFDKTPRHLGPWTADLSNDTVYKRSLKTLFQTWNINDSNSELHSLFFQRMVELLWKDTKHIQGTFFQKTSETLNVKLYDFLDRASDDTHPGPATTKAVAEDLALWCR